MRIAATTDGRGDGLSPADATSRPSRVGSALARLALLAAGLALAGWLLREAGGVDTGTALADAHLRGGGLAAEALFVLVGALVTAAGVPRQALAFLGGYAFGAVEGGLAALAGQALGCALAYGWARLVAADWAARRLARGGLARRVGALRDALAAQPFGATLALRLLPVGNNLALNLLAGVSRLPVAPFLAASVVGYVPQTAVFALLGGGVSVDRTWQVALGAALFAASALLGLALLRRHRAARAALGREGVAPAPASVPAPPVA